MEPIGEKLSEARKRLGINLREASEATKIRSDYLQEMESGTFDFPLPVVYKRGFLKIYARYLDLEAEPLIADFNAEFYGALARPSRRETPDANLGRVDAAGQGAASPDMAMPYDPTSEENRAMLIRFGVMIGVVVLVVVLIYMGLQHLLTTSSGDTSAKNAATNTVASGNVSANATVRTPPTAPRPPPANIQLIFTAKNDISSLSVRQLFDRREIYNGTLRSGQSANVTSQGAVEITASQTENLIISQNGKAYFASDNAGKQLTGARKFTWPPGSTQ